MNRSACPPHESSRTLGVHPMNSRPLDGDHFQTIVDEARAFLRPFAGDMPDASFEALVLHVSHVRRRDNAERHTRKRAPFEPIRDAE